jgi:hypothetical protein
MSKTFYGSSIKSMNTSQLWKNSINTDSIKIKNPYQKFKMHATWDYDLHGGSGRQYIALPEGTDITNRAVKKKYNLM